MKIYQIVPSLSYGDAIGNEVIEIHNYLEELGYDISTISDYIDKRIEINAKLFNKEKFESELSLNDLIIYHKATGSHFSDEIINFKCKKIMIYHNITPEKFFYSYNKKVYNELINGRKQLEKLKDTFDYVLADSEYNKKELVQMGFNCPIDVQPLVINFDVYKEIPDENIINLYSTKGANIIFTGRIAPNKKQEDIIKTFYYYKNYVDVNAKLFLIGSYNGTEKYYAKLKGFVKELNLKDVYFTGHIPLSSIVAYYKIADVFLCMSEHEGFCVPLLESMYFDVPIVTYKSTAIPSTMGNSGIVISNKDYISYSEVIRNIINDSSFKKKIIISQRENLKRFSKSNVKSIFSYNLKKYIDNYIRGVENDS